MAKVIEGSLVADGIRFGLVVARFNSFVTEALLAGAQDAIKRHGGDDDCITIVRVPGSFEIPLACQQLALSGQVDVVVALGAVIRGSTSHYDLVCSEVSKGVASVGLQSGVPVIFGVITTDSIEQAIERAGTKAGNKGFDAAVAAIEMVNITRKIGARKG
jgi:6,7-dimethyl-8-ribityllumazine synthase